MPQTQRLRILQDFVEGRLPVLVATDVAARGLHVPDVSHVFNFDLPQNAEDYVHRIGRTARAGASGDAVSFACERYVFSLTEIEDYVGHKISVARVPDEMVTALERPAKREYRARPGGERGRGGHPERRPGTGRGPRSREHEPRRADNAPPRPAPMAAAPAPSAPPPPAKPAVTAPKPSPKPQLRRGIEKPAVG